MPTTVVAMVADRSTIGPQYKHGEEGKNKEMASPALEEAGGAGRRQAMASGGGSAAQSALAAAGEIFGMETSLTLECLQRNR
ncbi:hypothetical protein OsI_01738 [Oryza sativa Indica Group]|uniref:Uncharacterized protein n=1 Tax=Oryza sativa subsp. indica TaxID=39946 RepID=A2WPG4_ORYSI|nr:hypothetical protein OsI_01738 [Oryza sativa Indica Group]